MVNVDVAARRLPIVLVVDPETASRHLVWRVLSRSFGVLEARDARRARDWLTDRTDIDALIVQRELPDAQGSDLLKSLRSDRLEVASRSILVTRPVDLRAVLTSLTSWFFTRDSRDAMKAEALRREAARLAS
jgi:DNA-binding response OmpR family regulator